MDIFGVLTMVGGLALFLYGMHIMGDGLAKVSGGKLERILEKLTSNPLKAVLLGAGVTAVIQSSSATTVMVVGFVNSGIMKLSQAVGIIMGANVGTTMTSWILSLSGIEEGGSLLLQFLRPSAFSPIFAAVGVYFIIFLKQESKRDIGEILIGFAILMFGMDSMSNAVKPLADVPEFTSILTMFKNPVLGMIAGAVLTAIIQSSSASVGILQALCVTGSVSFSAALPIIMGQNIGTCITALLSSVGASRNAKRAALVHLYFNLIGTTVFMAAFYLSDAVFDFAFMDKAANAAGIAVVHSIFNIIATVLLLPFSQSLVKLACLTIKEDEVVTEEQEENRPLLDVRFLDKPAFAIEQCRHVAVDMSEIAKEALLEAVGLLKKYNEEKMRKIIEMEEKVDAYEDELGSYLVRLSSRNVSEQDSHTVSMLLHCIGDFERISDHARNIAEAAREMHEKKLKFSDKAKEEMRIFSEAVMEIVNMAMRVFAEEDAELADTIEPLEEVIDKMNEKIKKRHIKRLRNGKCTIELGFILADITTNYERVADHCSNIAVCVIQIKENSFDTHEYLDTLDKGENTQFRERYLAYADKYALPK